MRRPAAATLVLGALVAVAAGACSLTNDLDMLKAESSLKAQVASYYGVEVEQVDCPAEVSIDEGATFTCTATFAGQRLPLRAHQDDGEGNVTFEATAAVVDVVAKTAELQAAIRADNPGAHLQLGCGDRLLLVVEPGGTFECQLTRPDGPAATVVVTVADVDGATTYTTTGS